MAVRPFLMISSKARVGFLNSAAVRALPIEMFAPAAKVPSSLARATRFPPSSTTAMTPPGAPTRFASAFAAAMTFSAPSRLNVFFSTNCALAALNRQNTNRIAEIAFFIVFPNTARAQVLVTRGFDRMV